MVTVYQVFYKKHYNKAGETDDVPTDLLMLEPDGDIIEEQEYIGFEYPKDYDACLGKEGYGLEEWKYIIAEGKAGYFESCLEGCPTVAKYNNNLHYGDGIMML